MADKSICTIPECDKPACNIRGWCTAHYNRWYRHGDPLKRVVNRGDARQFLETVAIPYDGDECLLWPFAKTKGYGWIKHQGKGAYVHRIVCEAANGPPPEGVEVARHSCANGHLGCVTPKHLSWGTWQDNSDDSLLHGTRARGERQGSAKLTENDILSIIALKGAVSAKELADIHQVHFNSIYRIWRGERWGWLSSP